MRTPNLTPALRAILATAAMALAGCTPDTWKPNTVASQAEVGKLLITVTSVTPWSDIVDALQFKPTLSADDAVKAILPVVYQAGQTSLSQIGGSFAANLPTTGTTVNQTQTLTNGQTPGTNTGTHVDTLTPGAAVTSPQAPAYPLTAPQALPTPPVFPADPLLAIQAGKSLFESTVLESRELVSAATRKCYVPYLVRLRLTVQSDRPYLQYNINSNINFFAEEDYEKLNLSKLVGKDAPDAPASACPQSGNKPGNQPQPQTVPIVVPIVATDNIERAIAQQSASIARAFSASLTGMVHGLSFGGAFNDVAATINTAAGSDYNTRLSVARQVDNGLAVHIGAALQGHSGRALVDQPSEVATILLVPYTYFRDRQNNTVDLRVFSDSEYRNAETGTVLPDAETGVFLAKVDLAFHKALARDQDDLKRWDGIPAACRQAIGNQTLSDVRSGNVTKFAAHLTSPGQWPNCQPRDKEPKPVFPAFTTFGWATLWAHMSAISGTDPQTSSIVQIPTPGTIYIPDQAAVLKDDGHGALAATFYGATGRSISGLIPSLIVTPEGSTEHSLAGTLNIDAVNHIVTATFPSLADAFPDKKIAYSRILVSSKGCRASAAVSIQDDDVANALCPTISGGAAATPVDLHPDRPAAARQVPQDRRRRRAVAAEHRSRPGRQVARGHQRRRHVEPPDRQRRRRRGPFGPKRGVRQRQLPQGRWHPGGHDCRAGRKPDVSRRFQEHAHHRPRGYGRHDEEACPHGEVHHPRQHHNQHPRTQTDGGQVAPAPPPLSPPTVVARTWCTAASPSTIACGDITTARSRCT